MIKIFQIYYDNEQKQNLTKGFIPYLNQEKSVYVENQCISDIRHSDLIEDADYIGLFSHRMNKKVFEITFRSLCDSITSELDGDIFSPSQSNWRWKRLHKPVPPYFPNQLNMKDLAYVDYFLSKVFELIESYDKDNWVFAACKRYPKPPKEWQDSTGFLRYPIIVFILERLINIYLQDRNLSHKPIL